MSQTQRPVHMGYAAVGTALLAASFVALFFSVSAVRAEIWAWEHATIEPGTVVELDSVNIGPPRTARIYATDYDVVLAGGERCAFTALKNLEERSKFRVARYKDRVWCASSEEPVPGVVEVLGEHDTLAWALFGILPSVVALLGALVLLAAFAPGPEGPEPPET